MKRYLFKCTLLTDAVITSMAATEGYKESLDYIPGSKFLGIAAGKLYNEDQASATLDIFHNGIVKFGDALPYSNENSFLKVPFSWFYEKGSSLFDKIYLHHNLPSEGFKQLKQARKGYFLPQTREFFTVVQDFSLKSAFDREKRKSEDGKMFGYFSLQAGTEWVFTIEDSSGKYAEEIKNVIIGKHRIGRSRSAEYGLVEIEFIREEPKQKDGDIEGEIILYAKSNLCFIDDLSGSYTAQPTAQQLTGSDAAEILWDKCHVRTRNYKTWNRKRSNRDADRVIIEAGSVFVLKSTEKISTDFMISGIGSHQNEGFGEVLLNPDFLTFSDLSLIHI